jgi:ribosomal protein S18 acetylase RimI-like enzyme
MIIRPATAKDLDALAQLSSKLSKYEHTLDSNIKIMSIAQIKRNYSKKLRERNTKFFVAEVEGRVIAYEYGYLQKRNYLRAQQYVGYIDSSYVEEAYRKKGIARKLTKTLVTWFRSKDIKHIELSVLTANTSSVLTWKRLGFEEYFVRMKKILR